MSALVFGETALIGIRPMLRSARIRVCYRVPECISTYEGHQFEVCKHGFLVASYTIGRDNQQLVIGPEYMDHINPEEAEW